MNGPVIKQLILKDWRLFRLMIYSSIGAGFLALAILEGRTEPAVVVGSVFFFIAIILVSCILPMNSIVNERKNQNLAFVMSLPVSYLQYTTAKLLANLAIFLIPWLTLTISAVVFIETGGILPRGVIPVALVLALLPFLGFTIITSAALVGEKEGWAMAANVFCNSSYGLTWYFLTRIHGLLDSAGGPRPVWNAQVLTILTSEVGLIVAILGLTYYLQSKKRDFI
jgi:ABC-2 type transport system permease protein